MHRETIDNHATKLAGTRAEFGALLRMLDVARQASIVVRAVTSPANPGQPDRDFAVAYNLTAKALAAAEAAEEGVPVTVVLSAERNTQTLARAAAVATAFTLINQHFAEEGPAILEMATAFAPRAAVPML